MNGNVWEVVGGSDNGGILVREERSLSSQQLSERLSTGSIVRELVLHGERLHYEIVKGSGPERGWVSLTLKGRSLLMRKDLANEVPSAKNSRNTVDIPIRAEPLGRKPRIACLHGGAGNEFIFRRQLAPLIAKLGEDVDWFFVEGKHISEQVRFDERGLRNISVMHQVFGQDQVLREHAVTRYGELGENGPFFYDLLDEGIAHSETCLAALAPIDVLLGFSQGANFSAMLAARAATSCEGALPPFRCLVLLENDRPGWSTQRPELFEFPLPTPALVISGSLDSEAGDAVSSFFTTSAVSRHEDGHRPLPKDKTACEAMVQQIRAFIFDYCSP